MPTQPIEVNIQSTGITQEDPVLFPTEDAELPSGEQLWQPEQEKRNAVHTEPPVKSVSHCYINGNCKNTLMQSMETFIKFPRILIEQNTDPVLLNFKRQMPGRPFDEQIFATKPRYIHYRQNKKMLRNERRHPIQTNLQ